MGLYDENPDKLDRLLRNICNHFLFLRHQHNQSTFVCSDLRILVFFLYFFDSTLEKYPFLDFPILDSYML